MAEYKYDEEGGQFLTFVITFLLLVLVPLTYSTFSPSRSQRKSQLNSPLYPGAPCSLLNHDHHL